MKWHGSSARSSGAKRNSSISKRAAAQMAGNGERNNVSKGKIVGSIGVNKRKASAASKTNGGES